MAWCCQAASHYLHMYLFVSCFTMLTYSFWWCQMEVWNFFNVGWCNDLMPDGTKALPEQMWTKFQILIDSSNGLMPDGAKALPETIWMKCFFPWSTACILKRVCLKSVNLSGIENKIDGFVQERHNCSALAMELHLSCSNLSKYSQSRKPLASPGHQETWHCLCKIYKSLSSTRKDFNYLCNLRVEKW